MTQAKNRAGVGGGGGGRAGMGKWQVGKQVEHYLPLGALGAVPGIHFAGERTNKSKIEVLSKAGA